MSRATDAIRVAADQLRVAADELDAEQVVVVAAPVPAASPRVVSAQAIASDAAITTAAAAAYSAAYVRLAPYYTVAELTEPLFSAALSAAAVAGGIPEDDRRLYPLVAQAAKAFRPAVIYDPEQQRANIAAQASEGASNLVQGADGKFVVVAPATHTVVSMPTPPNYVWNAGIS